jgi:hypothetical protein
MQRTSNESEITRRRKNLALRTSLAYPIEKRIFMKDYAVLDEVLAEYPKVKTRLSNVAITRSFRCHLEKFLFGAREVVLSLTDFRVVIQLGRGEISESAALNHLEDGCSR